MRYFEWNIREAKAGNAVWLIAVLLCFQACALGRKSLSDAGEQLPCFNAATELRYLRQQPERVDTVLISMCGMDSCVGSGGTPVGLMDFLQQTFAMARVSEAMLKPEPRAKHRLLLNGSTRVVSTLVSAEGPKGQWLRTCSGQLFPANIYEPSGALWTLYEVKHRMSLADPMQLSRGSLLTYVYRYLDSAKLRQTDTLKLKLSRFDDRVQGRFVRYHGQIQEPGVRYGTVDASLSDEKTPSVLWLFPEEVCRSMPEGFEGSCRFLWLGPTTMQAWLQSLQAPPSFIGTFSNPVSGTLRLSLEDQSLMHAYAVRLRGVSVSVASVLLQTPNGSLRFLPCAGNPLVLSAATNAASLELISVE